MDVSMTKVSGTPWIYRWPRCLADHGFIGDQGVWQTMDVSVCLAKRSCSFNFIFPNPLENSEMSSWLRRRNDKDTKNLHGYADETTKIRKNNNIQAIPTFRRNIKTHKRWRTNAFKLCTHFRPLLGVVASRSLISWRIHCVVCLFASLMKAASAESLQCPVMYSGGPGPGRNRSKLDIRII